MLLHLRLQELVSDNPSWRKILEPPLTCVALATTPHAKCVAQRISFSE